MSCLDRTRGWYTVYYDPYNFYVYKVSCCEEGNPVCKFFVLHYPRYYFEGIFCFPYVDTLVNKKDLSFLHGPL